nr:MAG TPA: hypothetical protein [Caudoviricetes sp.]
MSVVPTTHYFGLLQEKLKEFQEKEKRTKL